MAVSKEKRKNSKRRCESCGKVMAKNIYVGINLDETGILSGITFFGMKYTIDHKTGKLLEKEYMRW